jgi:hypothetical protein
MHGTIDSFYFQICCRRFFIRTNANMSKLLSHFDFKINNLNITTFISCLASCCRGYSKLATGRIRAVLSLSKCYCKQIRETSPAVQNEGSFVAAPMLESIAWWRRRGDTGGWGPSDATMTGRLLLVFMIAILSAAGTAWSKISLSAWVSPVLFVGSAAHSVLLHFTTRVACCP